LVNLSVRLRRLHADGTAGNSKAEVTATVSRG
jgi:hypothetical protein